MARNNGRLSPIPMNQYDLHNCSFIIEAWLLFVLVIFVALAKMAPIPSDCAIAVATEIELALIWLFHPKATSGNVEQRAARVCLFCAMSSSSWMYCIANRGSSFILFEAAGMVFMPFLSAVIKTANGWYINQRRPSESDVSAVESFYRLHFIIFGLCAFALPYDKDQDAIRGDIMEVKQQVSNLRAEMGNRFEDMDRRMDRTDRRIEEMANNINVIASYFQSMSNQQQHDRPLLPWTCTDAAPPASSLPALAGRPSSHL
mmetsp:Transcript_50888/g.133325  ORF Transcript_50888/g.133325 Transcript_50888/m.133325 type:complete len:259 (+) Transcript_50888:1-777(+)